TSANGGPIGTYNKPEDFCSALAKAMSAALSMDVLFGIWEQNVATLRVLNYALKQIGNVKPDLAKDLVNHLKSCATALVKPSTHTAEAGADDKASSEGAISTIAQTGIDKSALPIGEPKRHRSSRRPAQEMRWPERRPRLSAIGACMIAQWMKHLARAALVLAFCISSNGYAAEDPLPSWNDGPTKQSILDYVTRVTKEGGPDYVEPKDRLATFDNDGTLWIEQPMYNQFVFAIDVVRKKGNQHPEWQIKEPFKSVLAGDMKAVAAMGDKGMVEIVAATHSGMTTVDFDTTVRQWLATAKHPRFKVLYTDLVYQPM